MPGVTVRAECDLRLFRPNRGAFMLGADLGTPRYIPWERLEVLSESVFDGEYIDNDFFFRSLRRQWHWVVAGLVLGIIAGGLLATLMPRTYTSTASVFLDPLVGNPYSPTTPSSRTEQLAALTTEAGIVLTDSVITAAAEEARIQGVDIEPVRPNTATEIPSNSQVIEIAFTSVDPDVARIGAQELANALLAFRQERATAVNTAQADLLEQRRVAVEALLDDARERLDTLGDGDSASTIDLEQQVRLYAQQLAQVRLEETEAASRTVSAGTILNPAFTPTEQDGLSNVILSSAAFLAFISAGLLVALLAEHTSRRIRDEGDIARWGAPTSLGDTNGNGQQGPTQFLRVLPGIDESLAGGATVLVGLSTPRHVTAAALGFANAAALSGRRICVVVASPEFPAPNSPDEGLSDVLAGSRNVKGLAEIYVDQGQGVQLISPGTKPRDLPTLVQTDRCPALMDFLTSEFDLVIVATSWDEQVLAVRFARTVGKAVLVAEKQKTTGPALLAAATTLRRLGVVVSGTVLAGRPAKGRSPRRNGRTSGETARTSMHP